MEEDKMLLSRRKCTFRSGCWQTSIPRPAIYSILGTENDEEIKKQKLYFRVYLTNDNKIILEPEV